MLQFLATRKSISIYRKTGMYSPKYLKFSPNGPLSLNLDSTLIYIFYLKGSNTLINKKCNCQALCYEHLAWMIGQVLPVFDIKFACTFSFHILLAVNFSKKQVHKF